MLTLNCRAVCTSDLQQYFIWFYFANPTLKSLNALGGYKRGLERFLRSSNPSGRSEPEERETLTPAPREFCWLIKGASEYHWQGLRGSSSWWFIVPYSLGSENYCLKAASLGQEDVKGEIHNTGYSDRQTDLPVINSSVWYQLQTLYISCFRIFSKDLQERDHPFLGSSSVTGTSQL